MAVKIYTPQNLPKQAIPDECKLFFKLPTKTDSSHQDECDIHKIIANSMKNGGMVNHLNPLAMQGLSGDFTDVPDFTTAQNIIVKANQAFMTVPPEIRAMFNNSVPEFLDFLDNPANDAKAVALGLKVAVEAKPPAAPVAPPSTEPPSGGTT